MEWVARLIAGDRRQGFGNWTSLPHGRRRVTAIPLILCLSVASGLGLAVLTDPGAAVRRVAAVKDRTISPGAGPVIDGDTLEISGTRIRLWGIDAPEIKQSCEGRDKQIYECGRAAADALSDLTRGQHVECDQ